MLDHSLSQPTVSETRAAGALHSASSVGSRAWGIRSGGTLSARDRAALWALGVRGELTRIVRERLAKQSARELRLAELVIPDSRVARAAEQLCQAVSTASLVRHCQRSYAWGALLAARFELRFDAELFYVAALLHDLGLTAHAAPRADTPCFAVAGAHAAEQFLRDQGWDAVRAAAIGECITLHLNTYVPVAGSVEAHLLAAGTSFDVAGVRKRELTPELRAAVLERHPRDEFAHEFGDCLRQQVGAWPGTRIAMLDRSFGLVARLERSRL